MQPDKTLECLCRVLRADVTTVVDCTAKVASCEAPVITAKTMASN
jgi:hypothetical protein